MRSPLPSAELEILPGAGHWFWLDDPDLCASVVRAFRGVPDRSLRSA